MRPFAPRTETISYPNVNTNTLRPPYHHARYDTNRLSQVFGTRAVQLIHRPKNRRWNWGSVSLVGSTWRNLPTATGYSKIHHFQTQESKLPGGKPFCKLWRRQSQWPPAFTSPNTPSSTDSLCIALCSARKSKPLSTRSSYVRRRSCLLR